LRVISVTGRMKGDETAILRSGSEEVAKRGADLSRRNEGEEKAFFAERKRRKGDDCREGIPRAGGAVLSDEDVWWRRILIQPFW